MKSEDKKAIKCLLGIQHCRNGPGGGLTKAEVEEDRTGALELRRKAKDDALSRHVFGRSKCTDVDPFLDDMIYET